MFTLLSLLSAFLITVYSQYYSQYGYSQPAYYSRSSYGYSQYPSYGYYQYPGYNQQYQQYGYSNYQAPSLLGRLFGGGYNVDRYGNSYIGTPSVGFFLTCNGKGCATRG